MKKRILILDDDENICELLKRTLSHYFEVDSFTKGSAALAEIFAGYRDGWHYDALVLDCALPHFDGFTIARIVRTAESTGIAKDPVKIGFFTAYSKTVEQSSLLDEVRADQYWRKPDDIINLPGLITGWLEN